MRRSAAETKADSMRGPRKADKGRRSRRRATDGTPVGVNAVSSPKQGIPAPDDAEGHFHHAARLDILGGMAVVLVHELNQRLNVIGLATENALRLIARPRGRVGAIQGKLRQIQEQVSRAGEIVHSVLAFGGRAGAQAESFAPARDAWDAVRLVGGDFRRADIAVAVQGDCPPEARRCCSTSCSMPRRRSKETKRVARGA